MELLSIKPYKIVICVINYLFASYKIALQKLNYSYVDSLFTGLALSYSMLNNFVFYIINYFYFVR